VGGGGRSRERRDPAPRGTRLGAGSATAHPELAAEVVDGADLGALHLLEGGFELDQEAGAGRRVPGDGAVTTAPSAAPQVAGGPARRPGLTR